MPFNLRQFLRKVGIFLAAKEEPVVVKEPEPEPVKAPEPEPIQEIVIPEIERDSDEELEMDMGVLIRKRPSDARLLRKVALNPLSEGKSEDPELIIL